MQILSGLVTVLAVTSCLAHHSPEHTGPPTDYKAVAFLRGDTIDSTVSGNVTFTQQEKGKLLVEGTIVGLPEGDYGFHIHEKGDITNGCASTLGHYNPHKTTHGAPTDKNRHVGDLGNVHFDSYRIARVNIVVDEVCLVGEYSILGRGLVLHAGTDDFGRGGHADSLKTGNAGGRVACGVIGIL